jgi:tetratricopeptide (TPR) repeat protein
MYDVVIEYYYDALLMGKRIREIKTKQKLTVRELVERTGLSKNVIERTLAGTRLPEVSPDKKKNEYQAFATALGITEARLRMTDTKPLLHQIDSLLLRNCDLDLAYERATEYQTLALDTREELTAHYYLGRIEFARGNQKEALEHRKRAFELAENALQSSDKMFERACIELANQYIQTAQPEQALLLIRDLEKKKYFYGNLARTGILCHLKGLSCYQLGDVQQAKDSLREAYDYFRLDSETPAVHMGRIERCLAHVAYWDEQDYEQAKDYLVQAICHFKGYESDAHTFLLAMKELARVLMHLEEANRAKIVVLEALQYIEEHALHVPELIGKLLLLLGELTQDVTHTERILSLDISSPELLANVYHKLHEHYAHQGDVEKILFFHNSLIRILVRLGYLPSILRGEWF